MDDDLELLERFRSGIGQPGGARHDAQTRLNDLIIGRSQGHELPASRPRRRRALAGLAAAAILAVALVTIQAVLPLGTRASIDPAAASLLHRFSSLALKAPPEPAPQPSQYVYERNTQTGLVNFVSSKPEASFRYSVTTTEDKWLGLDGSGRSEGVVGAPSFLTEADRQAYERYVASGDGQGETAPFDFGTGPYGRTYGAGELTFFDFTDLPTNVQTLKGMIVRREIIGGPAGDWETFNLSADIMTWGYAPAELRAALFEVMADLPGVELIGRSEDALGRVGIAIGYTHDGERQEIVLQRGTGLVLERRFVSVSGDVEPLAPEDIYDPCVGVCTGTLAISGPPGTLSSVTTYRVFGQVVDTIGQVPDS